MAYLEVSDLATYLGISASSDDAMLQAAIDDAADYIDRETNRRFEAATATRYYLAASLDDHDSTILRLDYDLLTVTTLKNGDSAQTTITSTNYWLLPRNSGPPYHSIQLKRNTGVYWEFDVDYWASVAGTWGFSATAPSDIKRATLVLAAYYYRQKDSQIFDVTAIPEAGVIQIPQGIPATVTRVIEKYKRYL